MIDGLLVEHATSAEDSLGYLFGSFLNAAGKFRLEGSSFNEVPRRGFVICSFLLIEYRFFLNGAHNFIVGMRSLEWKSD